MTSEIPRDSWQVFFEDLTVRRFDWETKVEVLNAEIGDQILEEGLPLTGITCEEVGEDYVIEIFLGNDGQKHQTHNIKNPTNIAYLSEDKNPGGIVEFEETDGTKTLVHIIRPNPFEIEYVKTQKGSTV